MYEKEYLFQSKSDSIDTSYPDRSIVPFFLLMGFGVVIGSIISIHAILSLL